MIKNLCDEMLIKLPTKIVIFTDSRSAIDIIKSTKFGGRSKHIELRYYKIREWVSAGKVIVRYLPKELQVADMFSKNTEKTLFTRFKAIGNVGVNEYQLKGSVKGSLKGLQNNPGINTLVEVGMIDPIIEKNIQSVQAKCGIKK